MADQTVTTERPVEQVTTETRPVQERTAVPARRKWAHVSLWATLGLIISLVGLCATFTGLLAAEGFALGVIGGIVCVIGLIHASRSGVTGHSLAMIGLVFGVAAIVLSLLAIGGELSWLNHRTDEVARLHGWLAARASWLQRW